MSTAIIQTQAPYKLATFSVVVAATLRDGIGINGRLPWDSAALPGELRHFRDLTIGGTVIMGRKTWESLPVKPLPYRLNIVVSSTMSNAQSHQDALDAADAAKTYAMNTRMAVCTSFEHALSTAQRSGRPTFVIGGERLYRQALLSRACERVYLTRVLSDPQCDTFLPPLDPATFELEACHPPESDHCASYQRLVYHRRHQEHQYLDLIKRILHTGEPRSDRTGTGTLSSFGASMSFDLRNGTIPVLTTKRVFWKGVVEELLWMLRGRTNSKELAAKGVHIWDGNGSRAFLDNLGFTQREEGDLGPVYGFQWRHFGAAYSNCHADYQGQGIDQLAEVVRLIKEDPTSRRILMTAWNPVELQNVALPACHVLCQFYCTGDEGLSCALYQRSADVMLGVPFNIAFYSLLTHLLARLTGRQADRFHHFIGDAHIYSNHVDGAHQQLQRAPRPFPTLQLSDNAVSASLASIQDMTSLGLQDLQLAAYEPHAAIKMAMAV